MAAETVFMPKADWQAALNAVRSKGGTTAQLTSSQLAQAINAIQSVKPLSCYTLVSGRGGMTNGRPQDASSFATITPGYNEVPGGPAGNRENAKIVIKKQCLVTVYLSSGDGNVMMSTIGAVNNQQMSSGESFYVYCSTQGNQQWMGAATVIFRDV